MQIEAHSKYYEAKKSLIIKMSGDGARYNKSSTFCLLSFTFIRRHNSSASVGSDDPINDHENDGSGLSSAGKGSHTYLALQNHMQLAKWIIILLQMYTLLQSPKLQKTMITSKKDSGMPLPW